MAKGEKEMRRSEVEEISSKYLLKALNGWGDPTQVKPAWDAWLAERCPAVAAFVTSTVSEAGAPRQTSTLTIYYEEGVCKVCLGEREHQLTLWGTGADLLGALDALELRLQAPKVEWRRKSVFKTQQGQKRPGAGR